MAIVWQFVEVLDLNNHKNTKAMVLVAYEKRSLASSTFLNADLNIIYQGFQLFEEMFRLLRSPLIKIIDIYLYKYKKSLSNQNFRSHTRQKKPQQPKQKYSLPYFKRTSIIKKTSTFTSTHLNISVTVQFCFRLLKRSIEELKLSMEIAEIYQWVDVRPGKAKMKSWTVTSVRNCLNCEFFEERLEGIDGECRRRAPRVVESWGQAVYPVVGRNGWCGEFQNSSRKPEIPVKREEEKPKKAIPVWAVKKLQEVDWILVILHLKGEMFTDVVSQSKAKNAITMGVFDVESWRWLERNISEESWQIFVIALDFFQKHPEKRMVDFESSFWRQLPEFFRAALALCQKDETTLKNLGLLVQGEAPLMQIPEGQVAANVLEPAYRGYWNMRLRLVPGSHFETHLPTGILGVAVSRLDPLYLLARGAWIVGRHK